MNRRSENGATNTKSRVSLRAAALLASALAWGCAGGSGSSGFLTENAAIEAAIEGQACVDYEGLRICAIQTAPPAPPATPTQGPTGSPSPSGTPPGGTPAPTPTPPEPGRDAEVAFDMPLDGVRDCLATDSVCALRVSFSTRGFPAGTTFYLAVRENPPAGLWTLILAANAAGPEDLAATVPVKLSASPGTPAMAATAVQVAVLVYFTPPADVPSPIEQLIDASPDAVYVSAPFEVRAY